MIELLKKRDYFGITVFVIAMGMLVWFFAAKLTLFNTLAYQSDLFSHIQISRSWLEGRTAMFENNYGDHAKYHNYFFSLLIAPLVYWWGGVGIFITQFALYVLALVYSFPIIYNKAKHQKWIVAVFYLAIFCGAYAFWLYDDTWFGFHIEMLYIPLGLIFSLSLYKKQYWLSILSGVLIVLVKEDGAVLLACLHILYFAWLFTSNQITKKKGVKNAIVWGGIYIVVFVLGILYLNYKNDFGATRLNKAFVQLAETEEAVSTHYFATIFKNFGLLLLPLLAWLAYIKVTPKLLLWALLLLLPITVVNVVSGLVYLPHNTFSLTWVPRFSLTFSLFLALSVYGLLQTKESWFKKKKQNVGFALVLLAGLFAAQVVLLKKATQYSFSNNAIGIFSTPHPEKEKPYYADIKKIAEVLPYNYPVAPPYKLFRYFHKHDFIWISSAYNAWQPPRMVITDETLWAGVNPTERLQNPDSVITHEVNYYFEKEDRHYLVEAGIIKK